MSRGINAAVWVLAAMFAVTMLGGLGFYGLADSAYSTPADDTNRVVEALEEPSGSTASGQGVVESFTVGALDILQVLWIAVTDTSEVIMLFLPFQPIAFVGEQLARLAMGLTFAYFMRGVLPS